jgi:hypothetical protein
MFGPVAASPARFAGGGVMLRQQLTCGRFDEEDAA